MSDTYQAECALRRTVALKAQSGPEWNATRWLEFIGQLTASLGLDPTPLTRDNLATQAMHDARRAKQGNGLNVAGSDARMAWVMGVAS
jgi:hypothetical protein